MQTIRLHAREADILPDGIVLIACHIQLDDMEHLGELFLPAIALLDPGFNFLPLGDIRGAVPRKSTVSIPIV